ncbi:MAG: metal-dependent hydrolase [Candidatus Heimdallarchaeaceae archaeon]
MDSVSHGSVSTLIGFIFIQFYEVPFFPLLVILFVWGVLVDYDHAIYYKRKNPEVKIWNIPQLIKIYFSTVDNNDEFIYHTWLHEPLGVLFVSAITIPIFYFSKYPEFIILAISCYFFHFLLDLFSGKMKPLAPFNEKFTINWQILPRNSFTAASISLLVFLVTLAIQIFIGF